MITNNIGSGGGHLHSSGGGGLVNRKKIEETPIITQNEQQSTTIGGGGGSSTTTSSTCLIIFSIIFNIVLLYFLWVIIPQRMTSISNTDNSLPIVKNSEKIKQLFKEEYTPRSTTTSNIKSSFNIHDMIAHLLTNNNPNNNNKEGTIGSYKWYKNQLEQFSKLGMTKFQDRVMTKFGFFSSSTTSPDMFAYFRTFSVKDNCKYQHSCQIYPFNDAVQEFNMGNRFDAVLYHYHEPYQYLSQPLYMEKNVLNSFWASKSSMNVDDISSLEDLQRISLQIDELNGENVWRGMRTLSIYMNSEAIVEERLSNKIQLPNDRDSMQRFSSSHLDISACFMKNCTVWINYLYNSIEMSSSKFATRNPKYSSICAFISNCVRGGQLPIKRLHMLQELGKYVPIRQYGKCFKNAEEGPGGKAFELENNCKFYFAMENSIVTDYVTEKFYEGLTALEKGAKLLMIYKGAPNIHSFNIPQSMYINIDDFASIDELGVYLKFLNDNPEEFDKRFSQITKSDLEQANRAIGGDLNYKLGKNIPCRFCKAIGQVKLARYLLFKIGLVPKYYKVNFDEWKQFRSKFEYFGEERLAILDSIYRTAYSGFFYPDNFRNEFNLGFFH